MSPKIGMLSALLLCTSRAVAAQWSFHEVFSGANGLPGNSEPNPILFRAAFDGTTVAFLAQVPIGLRPPLGLYRIDIGESAPQIIADISSMPPGDPSPFDEFGPPSISDGRIVSPMMTFDNDDFVVSHENGAFSIELDKFVDAPDGPGFFTNYHEAVVDGDDIAFIGRVCCAGQFTRRGVYVQSATGVTTVANIFSEVPGAPGAVWTIFGSPDIENGIVAFAASGIVGSPGGTYTTMGGELRRVAGPTFMMPEHDELFQGAGLPTIDGDTIGFFGRSPTGHQGLYIWNSATETISKAVDANDSIPGCEETFDSFVPYSMARGNFVFANDEAGSGGGDDGLYALFNGELSTIIELGDTLDGREVDFIDLHKEALVGNTVAFSVRFTDETWSIYTATLCTDGDANGDHLVNMADLNIVLGNFLRSGEPGLPGDVNDDGKVNMLDLNMVLQAFHAE